jgi:replication-associated recombination protein RarA
MATINRLWVEKYRPKTLDEVIFQSEEQKKKFLGYRASKAFPNLLLSGTQGSGKTTIAKAHTGMGSVVADEKGEN